MKSSLGLHHRCFHRAAQAGALFSFFGFSTLALSQEPPPRVLEPKDHVLFVGTDLSVNQDGKFYHVIGATKATLKIEKGRELIDVRLTTGTNIKVNKGVKLSNLSAKISNVQTESLNRASARAQLAAMQAS